MNRTAGFMTAATCLGAAFFLTNTPAAAERCANGQAANERAWWSDIEAKAAQAAKLHAVDSDVVFPGIAGSEVKAVYQSGGRFAGQYLIFVRTARDGETLFITLHPTFDFCGGRHLSTGTGSDLFEVVSAKMNGVEF